MCEYQCFLNKFLRAVGGRLVAYDQTLDKKNNQFLVLQLHMSLTLLQCTVHKVTHNMLGCQRQTDHHLHIT